MKKLRLSLPLLCGFLAFAQSPVILVRVYSQPHVPGGTLRNAEKQAGALLEPSNIKISWEDCSKSGICDRDLAPNELFFCLRPPLYSSRRSRNGGRAVLGGAEIGPAGTGISGWVNYDLIQIVATRENISTEMLLAYVFAHEIAHLLGAVHESVGIMHDEWVLRELRRMGRVSLQFDRRQRDHMRTEVLARMQPSYRNPNQP